MRIALVEPVGRGGMIHYAFQLARALQARGADVTLVTDRSYELHRLEAPFRVALALRRWDAKPGGEARASGAAAAARRLRRAARALRHYREWARLAAFLGRERPDLALFGDVRFPTDLVCFRWLRASGLKLADICHNVHPFSAAADGAALLRRGAIERGLYRRLYRLFDLVAVHYPSNRERLLAAYGLDPARVAVIPHGNEALFAELHDPERGAAALRRELRLDADDRVVLLFGTLTRYKGADLLLEAFARLRPREPRARLVIAGFPAADFDLAGLRLEARRLGIEACLRLVPRYLEAEEVKGWMELADVVALPYRLVFQSGVLHLAQTFGRAVVATRVGAMAEAVEDGASGLLVPPEDPEALAAALGRLLGDPGLRRRLGERAAADARTRFSWEAVAEALLARLEPLAPAPQGRR